ncbi:MAG TPA: siroheme synthase CysG [Pseudorhodoplanes sp.]|nr:siroheme synthase CysG [Pseudorhodoplanes sp.]
MRFLPVFFDLSRGRVVLIGSGAPAIAKLRLLRAAGANVRWFANGSEAGGDLVHARHYAGQIDVVAGEPGENDLAGALAIVSSAGKELDERVASSARAHNIPVNIVDRPDLSTFIFPAVVDRGDVVVAISTGGASPVLARRLRETIEAILPARIGEFAGWMRTYRERLGELRERGVSIRRFWEKVIDGPIGAAFLSGQQDKAEKALLREFETASASKGNGVVHLVGAGPGDADLLTLRALQTLQAADVIFYDELIGPEILDRARRDAKQVFVGKRKGQPGIGQDAINRLLLEAAQAGQNVVRLKGGDPFIFGRGGEELEFLRAAGIAVTIVPGITAALGCAAEAGLPLTFRKEATRLTFVTANTAEGSNSIDWTSLADPQSTLVVYMGLTSAAHVQKGLISAGRDRATPVAVLARGTRPDSKTATGRLDNLHALAASVGEGPALLVVGDAVAHSSVWKANKSTHIEVAA